MKNMKAIGAIKHAAQKGFTIIELVVVILLLGILTATALPRFLDVTTEAHESVVGGVQGGLRTGLALFRANWFALSQPTTGIADFNSLLPNTDGFPIGLSGATSAALSQTHCTSIFTGVLQDATQLVGNANTVSATTFGTDATAAAMTNTGITDAVTYKDTNNLDFDFVAAYTSASPVTCQYWYISDAARQTNTTAPYLTYLPNSGTLTRSNIDN